ncbi:hypothetical protein Ocin01_10504 [Orchesella cincta]|uniref:Protein crumbs n=1 Tax=Orchesella cincta TaxID=48709 RepID=A0A1D2MTE1_ORCCI|nr:hypothetical protein Ocin01_10504 [Orchesella cincta]
MFESFALRFNSQGYLAYLELPQEVQSAQSKSVVTDGKWHSVTFIGPDVYLDDRSIIETGENNLSINWYNVTDNDTNHKINFFDGFVGCIRLQVPVNNVSNSDAPQSPQLNSNGQLEDPFALFKLFSLKGLAKYQPCDDPDFDLGQFQCFDPDTFVLCSKCQNNAKCVFTDGTNECECPEPEDETVTYQPPFCHKIVSANVPLSDVHPESRELHSDGVDLNESLVSSTTSHASIVAQSSSLMSSTTEHVASSSTVDESRVPPHRCPCENNGRCIQDPNNSSQTICDCEDTGYRGKLCKNDICDANPGVCTNGRCFDIPETEIGFECYCKPGWAGDRCDFNFDECLSNPCINNGTCVDDVNKFRCECQPGFDGTRCENEINECDSSPCVNGECQDLIANYTCDCFAGYSGRDCEIDIDDCANAPCENNGYCKDLVNGYECDCTDTGFFGENCEHNVDDCENSPCLHNGTCTDGIKEYVCRCYEGYNGTNCENDIPECGPMPCQNNGTCFEKSHPEHYGNLLSLQDIEFDYANAAGYVCVCEPGFKGDNCEINIDECQLTPSPCNGHGKCVDGINQYNCECDKGFEGTYCEHDINECEPNPCERAKECKDLAGDYFCECNDGYGGKNCTVPLTGCIQNVCYNEGSCTPNYDEAKNEHSFLIIYFVSFQFCSKPGFTGKTCQTRTTMGFNGSSLAEIVKNDDAYANNKYYLTFHFRTTLPDVVLAVGQGGTYYYLGLSGGKLNLQSSLINNLLGMSSGNKLHDGAWHRVVVSINSSHAILSADIEQVTLPIAEVEDIPQQPTGFNVTILGVWKSSFGFLNKQDLNPFVGCMRDVLINDDPVLPEEAVNVNLTNIVPSCIRKDQCSPNPCLKSGVCTDLWQKFTCTCPRPHLGERCQFAYFVSTFNHEDTPNSLATVDIPPGRFAGVFDISMFVRTREQRGIIFLLCDKERGLNGSYIEASVTKNGNLVVLAKWAGTGTDAVDENGGKPEAYTVDGQISDGNHHLISVQKDKGFVVIKVDDSEHFRKSHSNKVFSPTVMFIGGKPASFSDQESVAPGVIQEGHSGETSTSLPETPVDNNTEGTATDTEGSSEVIVPEAFRFKGTIQDVRINLSAAETSPSTLGHTSHPRAPNEYIVEFFNLTEPHHKRQPLGRVTIQNLLNGSISDDHCKDDPCEHGKCNTTWNDFKCDCYDGYDGKRCEKRLPCSDVTCPERSACRNIGHTGFECVADAAFDGKGTATPHYILRSNAPADLTFSKLNFTYRSKPRERKRGVNVIHMSNGTAFLRITLEGDGNDSSIVFRFMNNEQLVIRNATIFDGEWHSVEIRFSSSDSADLSVGLSYDKMETTYQNFVYHSNQYLKDLVLSHNLDIVVGSSLSIDDYGEPVLNDLEHSHSQYYSCLRNIYIGSLRLPFISQSKLEEVNSEIKNRSKIETTAPSAFYINEKFHTTDQQLPRLGCILCYSKDCRNEGQCTDPTQSYDCMCAAGYEGESCELDIDECVNNMCYNGSTCQDGVNNYTCACAKGFEGWLCEIDIDECEGNGAEKCNYNGQCHDGIGEFTCECDDDYTGTHCDKRKKSTCKDGPCEFGATCSEVGLQPNGVSFKCNCAPGYEGEFCSEVINYCKAVVCENGGTCNSTVHGFQCHCIPGFDGPKCEVDIDECSSNPCKNGGKCIDGVNSFTCDCNTTGFEGTICEFDVNECNDWPPRCSAHLVCENFKGSYICSCPDKLMCGSDCDILNPCFGETENKTCHNGGTCEAQCMEPEHPEASCICLPEYAGENCENFSDLKRPADESSVDILLIIIPVLAAILIAATVGIIILVRMARRKRATRGVYSPSQQEYCNPRVELETQLKPPPEERLI